jgi:hypothetical protein
MLNIETNVWTDQKGVACKVRDLQQQHLENISKMLRDILAEKRPQPYGSNQTRWTMLVSLGKINTELKRRANFAEAAEVTGASGIKVTRTITLHVGDSVADLIKALKSLPAESKLTSSTVISID